MSEKPAPQAAYAFATGNITHELAPDLTRALNMEGDMKGFDLERAWRYSVVGALLVAGACGGHDNTGPGGGGSTAGSYDLASTNGNDVPTIEQAEGCTPSRFDGGTMTLTADGDWQLRVEFDDETGNHVLADHGQYTQDGTELQFESGQDGSTAFGDIEDGWVVIHYDFCFNGEADTDFEFQR